MPKVVPLRSRFTTKVCRYARLRRGLNDGGHPTRRGGSWTAVQVGRLLARDLSRPERVIANGIRREFATRDASQAATCSLEVFMLPQSIAALGAAAFVFAHGWDRERGYNDLPYGRWRASSGRIRGQPRLRSQDTGVEGTSKQRRWRRRHNGTERYEGVKW